MSKLAKLPIIIGDNVKITFKDNKLTVTGPLGSLNMDINPIIKIEIVDNKLFVKSEQNTKQHKILRGTTWALIRNMIKGVSEGFTKVLEIHGVGYNAQLSDNKLVLKLGFIHPVEYKIPENIKVTLEQKGTVIVLTGIDKNILGNVAAEIRRIKPPEPYKGTGIRYASEHIIRKVGKTAITAGAAGAGAGAKK